MHDHTRAPAQAIKLGVCRDCGTTEEMFWWVGKPGYYKAGGKYLVSSAVTRCQPCYNEYCRQNYNRRKFGEVRPKRQVSGKPAYSPVERRHFNCATCGAACESSQKTARFCSDACRHKAKGSASASKPPAVCPQCGTLFPQRRGATDKTYCSPRCVRDAQRVAPSLPLVYANCKQCSRLMIKRGPIKYCSDSCRAASISDRIMGFYSTAMRELDVPKAMMWRRKLVEYLAQRDGGDCAICGKAVDLSLSSGPRGDDMGSSIDHVVPRSQGGSDDLANLRLTHWKCNRQRGNRGGMEQLRLVG